MQTKTKSRILTFILTLCLIFPCAFILSACGKDTQLTKEDYVKAFNSVTTTYDNYLTSSQSVYALNASVSDSDFEDANNDYQAKNMTKGSMAMLGFLRNICQNQDFVLKDGAIDCVVYDGTYNYDIRLTMSYNSKTSTITTAVYADYRESTTINYFVFDIVYDFDEEKLNSFSVLGYSGSDDNLTISNVRYYKFANNNLRVLSSTAQSFVPFAEGVIEDMQSLVEPARDANPADYSIEYLNAMQEAFA